MKGIFSAIGLFFYSTGYNVIHFLNSHKEKLKLLGYLLYILFLLCLGLFLLAEPCYAMEPEMDDLLGRIAEKRDKCGYFEEQLLGYKEEFNELIKDRETMSKEEWAENLNRSKVAISEAKTNLKLETRMLSILENKLRVGDFSEYSSTPTVEKRKFKDN